MNRIESKYYIIQISNNHDLQKLIKNRYMYSVHQVSFSMSVSNTPFPLRYYNEIPHKSKCKETVAVNTGVSQTPITLWKAVSWCLPTVCVRPIISQQTGFTYHFLRWYKLQLSNSIMSLVVIISNLFVQTHCHVVLMFLMLHVLPASCWQKNNKNTFPQNSRWTENTIWHLWGAFKQIIYCIIVNSSLRWVKRPVLVHPNWTREKQQVESENKQPLYNKHFLKLLHSHFATLAFVCLV